jgi:hypothetical protein
MNNILACTHGGRSAVALPWKPVVLWRPSVTLQHLSHVCIADVQEEKRRRQRECSPGRITSGNPEKVLSIAWMVPGRSSNGVCLHVRHGLDVPCAKPNGIGAHAANCCVPFTIALFLGKHEGEGIAAPVVLQCQKQPITVSKEAY